MGNKFSGVHGIGMLYQSNNPLSFLAALTAWRIANSETQDIQIDGSPVALDLSTPKGFGDLCRKLMRKSTGISIAPGIL